MIPAEFAYFRPNDIDEALRLLVEHGDEAKLLAGGHSLLPAMKLRLTQPTALIDIGRIEALRYIRPDQDGFVIGALTTHHSLASSALLGAGCPLLSATAETIGDLQVRNHGTLGGSLAHGDPAADWPAAILALEAEMVIVNRSGSRTVPAADFFVGLFQTALEPGDLLSEIRIPNAPSVGAYIKTRQKASGFAVAGAAVAIDSKGGVRVGITGVAPTPYRASAVEQALAGQPLTPASIAAASRLAAEGIEALEDLHASGEYRSHLACVNTRRALLAAAGLSA